MSWLNKWGLYFRSGVSSVAVDVGGTYLKGARVENGRVLGPVERRPMPSFRSADQELGMLGVTREIDPLELDDAVISLLVDLGVHRTSTARILVSGQMAGLAFV